MEFSQAQRELLEDILRDACYDFICDLEDSRSSEEFCPYGHERTVTVKLKFQNEGVVWTSVEIVDSEK